MKYIRVVLDNMKKQLKASDVYTVLARIPKGKITTYGDIARELGHPRASRAIGRILNKNPNPIVVPCHRVVMSNGTIGGYAFSTEKKKELLEKEGLRFMGNSMNDFAKYRVALEKLH